MRAGLPAVLVRGKGFAETRVVLPWLWIAAPHAAAEDLQHDRLILAVKDGPGGELP